MSFINKYKYYLLAVFFTLVGAAIYFVAAEKVATKKAGVVIEKENDLIRIKNSGVLKAVVDYNSTNYFVYRGKPMGFKYELLQELAKKLGVKLEISVSNHLNETFAGLKNGRFDVVAKSLTVTKERNKEIDFTALILQTRQVLVQRKRQNPPADSIYIENTLQLAGKKIYVQKNTSYFKRLQNLSEEIGADITIVEDSVSGVEQLVSKVAKGEIDYTVCDENIAKLNKTYYPNIDVSMAISFKQNIAWAVRKGSTEWKNYLDNWIVDFKKTRKYKYLYHKYFESSRIAARVGDELYSIKSGKISKYDKIVKRIAQANQWDWRLISAIIYQESRFNAEAGSWAGAYGLMQIMPSTAKRFGVDDIRNPEQNIKGGVLFLNWLNKQFVNSIPDSTQRIKFVLASYNIGLGHVMDAQRLAEKYGKNPSVWDNNVDNLLLKKSVELYYKDPVVRFGYCRGEEAYNYVSRVLTTYRHYLNVIPK